jgi:hypothetical protein
VARVDGGELISECGEWGDPFWSSEPRTPADGVCDRAPRGHEALGLGLASRPFRARMVACDVLYTADAT